ncbi:major facilitator superfamily domain-containing protein [Astrocystis sublimbata]|nr:major facilitator superfamily domain-containing protein [Astrocystis sublimbata]
MEQLDVQEATTPPETVYPRGFRLRMTVISLCIVSFLFGLDLTIVAAAVPSLTDYFKSVKDIGWYSSAYLLSLAALGLFYGKLYTLFSVKKLYLISIFIFEAGSLLCTLAPSSTAFILGRVVAGVGAAGIPPGSQVILSQCFPKHRRPLWTTLVSSCQLIGIVSAPIIGGALIDWVGWQGCFGINLPLGAAAFLIITLGLQVNNDSTSNDDSDWRKKLRQFDWIGTVLLISGLVSLLLALQLGGSYGWRDSRIIVLLVVAPLLLAAFGWLQYRLQDNATLPPRVLSMRTVLAAAWFGLCVDATLAVTEYFISIYFQGVKGYTATRSGLLILPLLAGIIIGNAIGGLGTTWLGYYNPFMLATTVLAPIASGLLTTISLDESIRKAVGLLGFLGLAAGLGLGSPIIAIQTIVKQSDLSVAISITAFAATLGNSVWIAVSTTLFQSRLSAELASLSTVVNVTQIENAGISEIRNLVGGDRLRDVLLGYDEAVTQTLYVPVGLAVAAVLGSAFTEWHSVKKKES